MDSILAVIIGGLISATTTFICLFWEHKHSKQAEQEKTRLEQKQWKREHTLSVYLEIASALEKIIVPVDEKTGTVVSEEYQKNLEELQTVIEKNRGKLALFAPHEINNQLMEFQAELYKLSITPGQPLLEYGDIRESPMVAVIKKAWAIENMLKKELLE